MYKIGFFVDCFCTGRSSFVLLVENGSKQWQKKSVSWLFSRKRFSTQTNSWYENGRVICTATVCKINIITQWDEK